MRKKTALIILFLALLGLLAAPVAQAGDKPCPWTISGVRAGKWANGNHKAGLWPTGSFPIPPGVSERPTWYVNGVNCGHSQIAVGGGRFLPNSSRYLRDGENNTITVKFLRPPYNGASNSKSFNFQWSRVPNGGYKTFR